MSTDLMGRNSGHRRSIRKRLGRKLVAFVVAAAAAHGWTIAAGAQTVVKIGIGTQDTTTNTVTTGVISIFWTNICRKTANTPTSNSSSNGATSHPARRLPTA